MNILGDYPGMPGVFIAGIFSAALSTLSTCLNAMAAIVLEDFCKLFARVPLSEKQTSYVMRGTVLVIGIISVALVFVVQRLGTVLQLSISMSGMTGGPIFGMFIMGLMCPWVKRRVNFIFSFYLSSNATSCFSIGCICWRNRFTDCNGFDVILCGT